MTASERIRQARDRETVTLEVTRGEAKELLWFASLACVRLGDTPQAQHADAFRKQLIASLQEFAYSVKVV